MPTQLSRFFSSSNFYLIAFLLLGLSTTSQAQSNEEIAESNRIFEWAERQYPDLFSPAGVNTLLIEGYVVRFYSFTNSWLGTKDGSVVVYGDAFSDLAPRGLNLKTIASSEEIIEISELQADVPVLELDAMNPLLSDADRNRELREGSPVRRINREGSRNSDRNGGRSDEIRSNEEFRSIDGSGNNIKNPEMGTAGSQLLRLAPADYSDGISALSGIDRPSPRAISNLVSSQSESVLNPIRATDMLWQWGQFLDHDIDLTDGVTPAEPANISVPSGDIYFDPAGTGNAIISFNRSIYDSELDESSTRQQINEITSWIDASNVYGSEDERTEALRTHNGDGKLLTSEGQLLPFNIFGLANAGGDSEELFVAGDVRANEQLGLTAMHTLFVREHNRLADEISASHPEYSGDEIFQRARMIVGAQMQAITYNEYLPLLMGADALSQYEDYNSSINASISNSFSTAAYRYGHSALSPTLLRLDEFGNEISHGHIPLRDAFFSPFKLITEGGIEPLLRGLATQICQNIDPFVIDDVRNFLFGPPGSGGFDLVALNIQRGRDHGLPSYNDLRLSLGLDPKTSFASVSSNLEIQTRLESVYENVNQIDAWVGGLAEDKVEGALIGELMQTVFKQQFEDLRDGDRFWYERIFDRETVNQIRNTSLSDIIRRNTNIDQEIPNNVFVAG